jgi:hypothetical protein
LRRDLKPTNIFLDAAGHVRLGDFGLAKRLTPQGRATLTGETGTYLYMSPEMVRWAGWLAGWLAGVAGCWRCWLLALLIAGAADCWRC